MGCRGLYGTVGGVRVVGGFVGLCGLYVHCMEFYGAVWVIGDIMGLHGVLWGCVGCRGLYVPRGRGR